MIPDPRDPGLGSLLPPFRRAREYRLYDGSGRRYLDLWQADGHAILGHRASGVSLAAKSALSRGLLADLPSPSGGRLVRSLRALTPSHPFVRLYASLESCLEALAVQRGSTVRPEDIADPAERELPRDPPGGVVLWRALAASPAYQGAGVLVPVLPLVVCGGPWALCFREDPGNAIAPSAPLSAAVLEGVARGVAALARHEAGPLAGRMGAMELPAWSVRGPYVLPRFAADRYPDVFGAFLRAGVVLSPRFRCPSVLPAVASEGETKLVIGLFRANPLE